jgi:Gram-negative bacterial TonB protein C-terminal
MSLRGMSLSWGATLLLVGCAAQRPAVLQPSALPQLAPEEPCVPVEYVALSDQPGELVFDVQLTDSGRAQRVDALQSSSLPDAEVQRALDIVRPAFHCRNRLARDAPRVVHGYKLRFVERLVIPVVDAAACAGAARYPWGAKVRGIEGQVSVGVTLDETGAVEQAWPLVGSEGDPYGFGAEAARTLAHHCRFTAARLHGKPVPFFLVYTFVFQFPTE